MRNHQKNKPIKVQAIMKKNVLFLVCALCTGIGTFAQIVEQEQEYDTVIYFPSTILECPMLFDTAANRQYIDNSGYDTLSPSGWKMTGYHNFQRLQDLNFYCNENVPLDAATGVRVVGHCSLTGIRSFAQPYYLPDLDSTAIIIGVAAKIYRHPPPMTTVPQFILYDHQGDMLDNSPITYVMPAGMSIPYGWHYYDDCEMRNYYFHNGHSNLRAFSIAYDKNHTYYTNEWGNVPYEFDHTIAFLGGDEKVPYYHPCAYDNYGCYEYIPPYYIMYDSTDWVRFDTDIVYSYYHKMNIGFYPIILVPKTASTISEAELSEHCNLVPNPASSYCKAISRYKIESIELFDMNGRRIEYAKVNDYEYFFNLASLQKGTYIVIINTIKGKASKQLIVN